MSYIIEPNIGDAITLGIVSTDVFLWEISMDFLKIFDMDPTIEDCCALVCSNFSVNGKT
jgi:hypothetical protein